MSTVATLSVLHCRRFYTVEEKKTLFSVKSSFTSYHGQLLSLAVQWGVAIEIERAVKKSASFC